MYICVYVYIYIYIHCVYIHDRWRVGPPPCLHCSFVVAVLSLVMSSSNCTDIGIPLQVSSSKCNDMDIKQPSLSKPSCRLHGGFLKALGCFLRALGRLLGGSWEALGRLLEASKRHLGPKTVIARIFGRFLKKNGNFGAPSWRRFNIKNRIF